MEEGCTSIAATMLLNQFAKEINRKKRKREKERVIGGIVLGSYESFSLEEL